MYAIYPGGDLWAERHSVVKGMRVVELYVTQSSGSKSSRQKEQKLALLPKNNQSCLQWVCVRYFFRSSKCIKVPQSSVKMFARLTQSVKVERVKVLVFTVFSRVLVFNTRQLSTAICIKFFLWSYEQTLLIPIFRVFLFWIQDVSYYHVAAEKVWIEFLLIENRKNNLKQHPCEYFPSLVLIIIRNESERERWSISIKCHSECHLSV